MRKNWLFNSSMWWRCRRPKRRPLSRSFITQHSPVKPCEVPCISTHTRVLLASSRPRPSPSFPFGSIFLITGTRSDCYDLTVLNDDDEMAIVIYTSRLQNRSFSLRVLRKRFAMMGGSRRTKDCVCERHVNHRISVGLASSVRFQRGAVLIAYN
jgi:hypothetical protein